MEVVQTQGNDKLTISPATGALLALEVAIPAGLATVVAILAVVAVLTGGVWAVGQTAAVISGFLAK